MIPKRKKRKFRKKPRYRPPELSVDQILAWADSHYERMGRWPNQKSGLIPRSLGENWKRIEMALSHGYRGLPGKSSLAQLFAEHRAHRNSSGLPPLTVPQILAWADAHHHRTGEWPKGRSGPIADAPGETWKIVRSALVFGSRGLPGGSSLAQLLAEHRGVRNRADLPPLTVRQILAWADVHFQRTGKWPAGASGPIGEAQGETWLGVDKALMDGYRGLAGGSSLARLLNAKRLGRTRRLSTRQILRWADEFQQRTGRLPNTDSGDVGDPAAGTWLGIDHALRRGRAGLPGGSSLAQLLAEQRGKRNHLALPRLNLMQILDWADRHHQRTGTWPGHLSGPVDKVPGQTWLGVDAALRNGNRGLPGRSSLAQVLAEHRGVWKRK